jgi:Asp-tRNA(Asn)/Glu-tRNA(Gln) amidotransferase A subunit family amidase
MRRIAAAVGQQSDELLEISARDAVERIRPRLGAPALNIPAGLSNGLPVGLQLDALPGHDSELLGLGIAVERVVGRIPAPRVAQR